MYFKEKFVVFQVKKKVVSLSKKLNVHNAEMQLYFGLH